MTYRDKLAAHQTDFGGAIRDINAAVDDAAFVLAEPQKFKFDGPGGDVAYKKLKGAVEEAMAHLGEDKYVADVVKQLGGQASDQGELNAVRGIITDAMEGRGVDGDLIKSVMIYRST